jgi:hypothetical protein
VGEVSVGFLSKPLGDVRRDATRSRAQLTPELPVTSKLKPIGDVRNCSSTALSLLINQQLFDAKGDHVRHPKHVSFPRWSYRD